MSDQHHSPSKTDQRKLSISSGENITFRVKPTTIPAFIEKLFMMVNDQHIEEKISWSENGESFIVFDIYEFSEAILPQYFKHNKWSSFVRQLNTYGFCKVTDYKNDNDKQTSEFRHPLFYRNGQHVLHKIRRNMRTNNLEPISPQYNNNLRNPSVSLINQFTPLLMVHTTASTATATETTTTANHNNRNKNKIDGSSNVPLTNSLTNINANLHNLIDHDNRDEATIGKCLIVCRRIENLQNDIEMLQAEIASLKQTIYKQHKIIEKLLNHILQRMDGTPQSRDDDIKRITTYLEWIQNHELPDIATISKNNLYLKRKEYNTGTFYNHATRFKLMDIDESEVELKMNHNNDSNRDSTINSQEKSLMQTASPKIYRQ